MNAKYYPCVVETELIFDAAEVKALIIMIDFRKHLGTIVFARCFMIDDSLTMP